MLTYTSNGEGPLVLYKRVERYELQELDGLECLSTGVRTDR